MKPCPLCGCTSHKLAFAIRPGHTTVAVACYCCEHTGPEIPMTFPPSRATRDAAADAWDMAIPRAGKVTNFVTPQRRYALQ